MTTNDCKLAYVSGPYADPRGEYFSRRNLFEAENVAASLWQMGLCAICWHRNVYAMGGIVPAERFLVAALVTLKRCDLVVLMPNWQDALESRAEKIFAEEHKVPTYVWPLDCTKLIALGSGKPPTVPESERLMH